MTLEERDLRHIWHPCSQMKDYEELPPIPIARGSGVRLYDVYGKEYIDIVSSWWCNLLGHCNPVINDAIKAQLDRLEHVIFANFTHEPAIRLCEELSEIVPRGLTKFNFSDNGSASVAAPPQSNARSRWRSSTSTRRDIPRRRNSSASRTATTARR